MIPKPKKINLYLMSLKGFSVLKALHKNYPEIINIVQSAQDEQVANDYYTDIKDYCLSNQIEFKDKKEKFIDDTPYSIAISWKWLILKPLGQLIVLHDSILPKYRGFNPLVSYLINGERKIGVTAIFSAPKYDEGDIIKIESVDIIYPIKIQTAIEYMSKCYKNLVLDLAKIIYAGEDVIASPQDHSLATYSLWRDNDDYEINWTFETLDIERFINAVGYPYKSAFTTILGKIVRITNVEIFPDVFIENRTPGKILFLIEGHPIVVCGIGLIKINKAYFEESSLSIMPYKKIRTRFGKL